MGGDIYTYAQHWPSMKVEWDGFKLVEGRTEESSDETAVAETAKSRLYRHLQTSLITITEMEKLMGKKKFNDILET